MNVNDAREMVAQVQMAAQDGRIKDIVLTTEFAEQFTSQVDVQDDTHEDELAVQLDIAGQPVLQESFVEAGRQQIVTTIAASIGHELNNIATIILGNLELIRKSADNPIQLNKFLDLLPVQIHKIVAHGQNLLTIGKPHTHSFHPFSLPDLLEQSVALLTDSEILSGFAICRDYQSDLPKTSGDVFSLQQVVINLIINAVHAMGE